MRSVKSKLFTGFAVVIFVILLLLAITSIELFSFEQENKALASLEELGDDITLFIEEERDSKVKNINRYVEIQNHLVIILKGREVLFSNQTNHKTEKILSKIKREHYYDYDDHDDGDGDDDRYHDERHYNDFIEENFFQIENLLILQETIKKRHTLYRIYLGVDEDILDKDTDDIAFGILTLVFVIYIIIVLLGYFLINKTIKPLRIILEEVKSLQGANDLSQRVKESKTNDEFEELTNSFNLMLGNIEKS
ncbi:MAG: HAMP domain-containing protein, partial [Campylobacterales bacterium]|nr:HAMP domain-containing protein [Campylobacterales bacterium]